MPAIRPATIILAPGTKGTYSDFPATILRHYDGNMYEIRVPGGECCIDVHDFVVDYIAEGLAALLEEHGEEGEKLIDYRLTAVLLEPSADTGHGQVQTTVAQKDFSYQRTAQDRLQVFLGGHSVVLDTPTHRRSA